MTYTTQPAPTCGHTYKLTTGKVFRCDAEPHTRHPERHYFVRAADLEIPSVSRRGSKLVVIPGERRDG